MDGVQVWKPWGYYVDIHRPSDKKIVVKEIVVDPGGQLVIYETQVGECDEDDIVRLSDPLYSFLNRWYGREL